ncbi:carboxypeptidase-like regulatory domain-containing protein [Maribacter confluentis]
MVKELHEKGGFNLLVFESGLYDNFKANQLYSVKKEDVGIFKQSVGSLYSDTEVFQDLLDYIETHQELKILGFDSQESNLFDQYFLDDFKTLCTNNNISISKETYIELEKTLVVRDLESYVGNKKDSTALYDRILALQRKIDLIPKSNLETKVIVQTFKSVFSDLDFNLKSLQKEKIHVQNPRDKQMAENLTFIKETYPNEKIIGWGASYHFANRLNEFEFTEETENYIKQNFELLDSITDHSHMELNDEIEQVKSLRFAKPMGQILKENYGDKLFSLAFTSYEGNYLDIFHDNILPILNAPTNSIESKLIKQGAKEKLKFLENIDDKFYSSALGYIPLYANWNNVFDGIYFIEKMYPPIYSEYDSHEEKLLIPNKLSTVSGTVLDTETSQQIAYADIYYSDNNLSTISNLKGEFSISNSNKQNSYLIFSAIGYESDSVQVQELQKKNTIRLKKSNENIVLNEVVVTAKLKSLSAEEIIKKARKNIERNYVQTPYNQSYFFKIIDFNLKDSLSLGEEALIQTYNQKGVNGSNRPENNFYGEIQHLRNNTDKYDKDRFNNGIGSLWVVLNRDIILSKTNVLYRTSSYDLTNDGTVNYEGRKVYQISFENNSPGAFSTGYGYPAPENSHGKIFVDSENFAVLRYEHCIKRAAFVSKKTKNTIQYWHKIVQSYKNVSGMYFINLLDVTNTTKVYSPENTFLNTYIQIQKLVSNNIETKNVSVLKRPLIDLKKGFKKNTTDPFWNDRPIDLEIKIQENEECGEIKI